MACLHGETKYGLLSIKYLCLFVYTYAHMLNETHFQHLSMENNNPYPAKWRCVKGPSSMFREIL